MKRAVSILQPVIEAEKSSGGTESGQGCLGHREGRCARYRENIVSIVLSCNNYEIVDLGVMVS